LRWAAIVAALLAHAALITGVLVRWPALFPVVPAQPPAIPVTLVNEVPRPPPPPRPAAASPKPPAPQKQYEAVSGKDQETTAPPQAKETGPEAAPAPTPPPPTATAQAALDAGKPSLQEPQKAKPKIASRETAPVTKRGIADAKPGDAEHEGDPYLNQLKALVEQHRFYPSDARGSLGISLEGIAIYSVAIGADGRILGVELDQSAGAQVLDQTALEIIERSAPFPPPPRDRVVGGYVVVTVPLDVYPVAH
jgi:protein TonB